MEQVGQAFQCLINKQPPPKGLQHLILKDWLELSGLLQELMQEKQEIPLH
jgi:hypothetical protein